MPGTRERNERRSGRITVTRRRGSRDVFRSYRVLVDGEVIGTIRPGSQVSHPVEPGEHTVQVQVDWTGSPPLGVDVPPGGAIELECRPAGSFVRFWQAFSKDRYVQLERR